MKKSLLERIELNSQIIDKMLHEYLGFKEAPHGKLYESMRYSVYSGGKRIRPFLTLEICEMLGGKKDAALPYACAIEMIHTYSLIHDDLPCMDNDDFRRGEPSNHKKFGEATALLAGDSLLTYAFGIIADNKINSAEKNLKAISVLSENAGHNGMIGGQVLDIEGEAKILEKDVFYLMNKMKTGCLIKAACLLGVIAAGYSDDSEEYSIIERFAEKIGLAFQIEDDILDFGTEDNKNTFLSFMSVKEAAETVSDLTESAKLDIKNIDTEMYLSDFVDYLATRKI